MKNLKLLTTLSVCCLVAFFYSCKSQQKPAGPQPTKDPAVYKGVTDNKCAIEMAFGSPGSGIDGKAYDKVMEVVNKNNLENTATPIGREGETRICLPMSDVKGEKKKQIIDELTKIAREGQFVSISIR